MLCTSISNQQYVPLEQLHLQSVALLWPVQNSVSFKILIGCYHACFCLAFIKRDPKSLQDKVRTFVRVKNRQKLKEEQSREEERMEETEDDEPQCYF
jgi:hypothetical protein